MQTPDEPLLWWLWSLQVMVWRKLSAGQVLLLHTYRAPKDHCNMWYRICYSSWSYQLWLSTLPGSISVKAGAIKAIIGGQLITELAQYIKPAVNISAHTISQQLCVNNDSRWWAYVSRSSSANSQTHAVITCIIITKIYFKYRSEYMKFQLYCLVDVTITNAQFLLFYFFDRNM